MLPLTQHDAITNPLFTTVHCVGENYSPSAWKYRSCQFRNLCLVNNVEAVALESLEEKALRRILDHLAPNARNSVTVSTLLDATRSSVSLGASSTVPWFPRVVTHDDSTSSSNKKRRYAMLPDSVVLVPISISAVPPSSRRPSVLWNDIYPIYILLSLFELESKQIVLVVRGNQDGRGAADRVARLIPILGSMGRDRVALTLMSPSSASMSATNAEGDWICAKYAVAGLGLRRYDEARAAGEASPKSSVWYTQSASEGINLWAFRSFMIRNMQLLRPDLQGQTSDSTSLPLRVAVQASLWHELLGIQKHFKKDQLVARALKSAEDFTENAKLISESQIVIAALDISGDFDVGMVTFLPRSSFLFLLVDDVDSYDPLAPYGMSQKDWELLHSAAYFDMHLLPLHDVLDSSSGSSLLRSLENVLEFAYA
jgi:hypothetical protein